MTRYLIAGGGVAGVTAAKEIQKLDADAVIDIFSNESYPYYYRPRLWEYIAGRISAEETIYRPAVWYAEQGINLHLNTSIVNIDAEKHLAWISDGSEVSYDRLLIASGSSCYVPPIDGVQNQGVFTLRTLADAKEIVAFAEHASHVVQIGGGLLGLETAKALVDRGLKVTVIEFFPQLLPRQLDAEGAGVLTRQLEQTGMTLLTGQLTQKIEASEQGLQVMLQSGLMIEADMVVISAGIRSNIDCWKDCGVEAGKGIKVNAAMQTSLPDVFAAGDVVEYAGVVHGIIPVALDQANVAAANMVRPGSAAYTGTLNSTKLKVTGMEFTSLGDATADGDGVKVLRRSDPERGRYQRLAIKGGKLIGAIVLGDSKRAFAYRKLISAETPISQWVDDLLDDEFNLQQIVPK